jgi:hypothetical protein
MSSRARMRALATLGRSGLPASRVTGYPLRGFRKLRPSAGPSGS